jgi:predicted nucleotidyltransferase
MAGSRAYGMATPTSDLDHRGLFVAPPEYVLGAFKSIEQVEYSDQDTVIYELGKFVKLASDANPNIIELLFTDGDAVLFTTPTFERLKAQAHLFLSKKARHTFSGYAMAQLKRIKGHHKWIMNPQPEKAPSLAQYTTWVDEKGKVHRLYGHDNWESYWENMNHKYFLVKTHGENCFRMYESDGERCPRGIVTEDGTQFRYTEDFPERLRWVEYRGMLLADMVKFKEARTNWRDYWDWKRNRNEARAALEEKHGFDTKHASHLVRLMRMAEEILTEGKVIVRRPDAKELLAIRNGSFDYDQLITWAAEQDEKLEKLYATSPLQNSPNREAIDALLIELRQQYWREHGLA